MRNFNTLEIWGKVKLTPRNLGSSTELTPKIKGHIIYILEENLNYTKEKLKRNEIEVYPTSG